MASIHRHHSSSGGSRRGSVARGRGAQRVKFANRQLERVVDLSEGLNDKFGPLVLTPKEVAQIVNYNFDEKGALQKRRGYVKHYAAPFAVGPVRGLTNYRKEDGTSRLVIAADGTLFYDKPNFIQLYDTQTDWQTTGVVTYFLSTTNVPGDAQPAEGGISALAAYELGGPSGALGGDPTYREAIWQSNTLDISAVADKTTGKITEAVTIPAGTTRVIETRVGLDGVSWSAWTGLGAGNTIQGVGVNTKLQVRVRYNSTSGLRASEQSLQVSFDVTPTVSVLGAGLSTSARFRFATQNDTLWIVNGENANKKWDGTTYADQLGTPPVGKYVIVHKNRMFIAGTSSNRSRLYFSDLASPESWPALNFIDVGKGDGDAITGLGINLDTLVVTKDNSVWNLSGDSASNFVLRRATDEGGSVGMASMALVRDSLAWLGKDGVRFFDGVRSALASEKMENELASLNKRQLAQASGIFYKFKYYIAVPEGASLTNNAVLVYDSLRQAWTIYRGIPAGEWCIYRQFNADTIVFGSSTTGQVYDFDTGYTDDGVAIDASVTTKAFQLAGGAEAVALVPSVFVTASEPTAQATTLKVSFIPNLGVETVSTDLAMKAQPLNVLRAIPSVAGVSLVRTLAIKLRHVDNNKGLKIEAITIQIAPKGIRAT